eukprot:scaffold189217_cov16-Prasinocladus_malaysianus.AAC.1
MDGRGLAVSNVTEVALRGFQADTVTCTALMVACWRACFTKKQETVRFLLQIELKECRLEPYAAISTSLLASNAAHVFDDMEACSSLVLHGDRSINRLSDD